MNRDRISYYYDQERSGNPVFTVQNDVGRHRTRHNRHSSRPNHDWEEPTYHANWKFNRNSSESDRRHSELRLNANKNKFGSSHETNFRENSSKRHGQMRPPNLTDFKQHSMEQALHNFPEMTYMEGNETNRSRKIAICSVIVLIVLSMLIILGAGIYVIISFLGPLSTSSSAGTTAQTLLPVTPRPVMVVVVGVELDATVSLSNRAFIPAYNNDLSPQYQELSLNFTNTMDAVFYNSDLRGIYNGTTVNGFSAGSVVVNFTINLIQAPTVPTQDPSGSTAQPPGDGGIDDQISAVRGQVEVSIKEVIQIAENNGELTTLGVDSTSLAVTKVSVDVETQTVSEAPTTVIPSTPSPDQEPPVIECPDDVTAETDPGAAYGFVSWTNPTATDNSGDVTVEVDFVPGQLPIGSRNVTATATDSSGNSAQCVFVATVVDVEAPVAICPDNITRSTDLGQAYATVSWSSPRGTDNSGTISGITTDLDEGQFEIGSHEITVTVVDPAGLEGQCTFDIVVQDNEAPAVECPATIEIGTDAGGPSSIVTWNVSAEDNSGSVPSISSSPSSGDVFTIGTHTVNVTALDESGNMGQCSFSIVVLDTELPVINCPANIIQPTDSGSSSASVTWQVTSTDNSGETPTTTSSTGPGLFSVGSVVIITMATDSSGNTASCNFTVQIIDEEAPTISCPDNITVTTDVGASSAIVTWVGPFASDNSGQTTVQTDRSPGLLPIGIQMVNSTAVDEAGNEAQCSFWVNVQDLENPIVSCPSDITAELAASPVLWDATATDNSEEIANLSSSPLPADLILGENIVTVIAVDPSGNKAECNFTVTLTDTTAPSITCPADVLATVATDESSMTLTWDEPSATDLSGDVTVTVSHSPGVYTIGQITVTANATDSSGNQANCVFLLTIQDLQHPMISNCPASISVNTDSGLATAVVNWTSPSASDNSGSVSLTSNYYPGDTFPIGSTRVTYTATDSSGNFVMTCTFDIAVNDNERPIISGCPSAISVNTDSGVASWAANWTEPTATDNSGIQTLISDYYLGYPMPIGSTTVTYTSTDVTGYSATCMFVVTVIDNERPIISGCPSSVTLNADNDKSTATVMWTEPTASDNSGFQNLTSDYSSGSSFPGGTTNVTYISTDNAGNTQICSFDVTVIGNASVTISGSLAIAGTFTAELADSSSELFQSTAANLVRGFDVIFEPLGSQYLGSTVNGFSNGSIFSSFTVNLGGLIESNDTDPVKSTTELVSNSINKGIEGGSFGDLPVVPGSSSIPADTEPPIIRNCPDPLPYSTDLGQYSGTAIWTVPMATDNFGIIDSIVSNYKPGDSFPVGSTLVTYTFTDASRNNASCIFIVTVKDTEAPVVSNCPSSLTFQADNGQSMGTAIWSMPTASDNSGMNVTMTSNYDSEDSFPIGSTTVTISFEDSSGNTAYCSFNVTIIGNASFTVDGSLTIAGMFSSDLNDPTTVLYQNTAGGLVNGFNAILEPLGSQYLGVIVTGFMNGSIDAGFSVILDSLIEHNGSNPLVATRESIKNSIENGIGNGAFGDLPVVPGSLSVYQDEENPVISECPSDQDVNTDSGNATALVTWTPPTATDNSGTQTLTSTANPVDYFPIGNTTVKYTSTDASGNTDVCTFYITVIDSENPVISGCPSNQDVSTDSGNATALVTWTPPTATDNSGNQTLTSTANTGGYFPIGNISVTYTSKDVAGNTDTCTFYISVTDNENPVISGCPSNQDVSTNSGSATALVTWAPPTATDNSGNQTLISTANPGDYFPIGNNTVTYTSADPSGNTDVCTFYVTVIDNDNPVITGCPSDQNVTTDIGNATAVVTWTPPTATDNSGNQTLISTVNPGDYLPIGNNIVNYTSTDAAGNTDTCTFYISVTDNEDPVFSGCPSNQDVNTDSGNATALVTWTPPTATDNSGTQTLTSTANPGDYFPIGNNTVNYTSTDAAGNTEFCTFYVDVTDDESPVISGCPSNSNITANIGNVTAVVTWTSPTATDNSGNQTLTSTANPEDYFPIGNNTVKYTSTDASGNTDVCTFYVIVIDNENPVISGCPSDQNVTTDIGNATAVVTWTPPTATDNSGNQTLTSTVNPGDYFPIGNNTVTYTSTDAYGNVELCSFNVVVIDRENAMISGCPSNQDVNTDIGNATAVVTWTPPTATDNSGNQTLTSTANPGDYFPIGNNSVTYFATDVAGNSETCTFIIVVSDNENPVISGCPSEQNATKAIGNATAKITWTPPTATDNSGNQTLTSSSNPGDFFPIGNTTVNYTSTDPSGNTDVCTFYVIVIDNENPVISGCPSDQNVTTDIGNATAVVTWTPPTATDNSGNQTLTSTANPGDYIPIGNNTVTYTSTDASGNTDVCTFNVVVIDNENPVISGCPSDQNVTTDIGNATAVVTWTPPTATDNSGNQTLISTVNPGDYFPIGNSTVTYTSTDAYGNVELCSFNVVVIDRENAMISGCPCDQNVNTDIGNATAVVTWTPPTATDNSGNQTLTSTANPGDYFPIGNNSVTYFATDVAGNSETCTFIIVVSDNENPVISGCPSDQNVTTDIGNATAVVTWTPPTATDNSGNQTLISTANPGDYFPIGNNTVTYTSTDPSGNTDVCTFYVIVFDNENPVISGCPSDQNVSTDIGNATAVVTWTPPTATDNSGNQTLTSTANPGDYFPIGNNTVSYTSTDSAVNIVTCTFDLVVSDNENPVISGCPSDQNVTANIGNATAVVTWTPPTATDNSGDQTLTSTANPGDYFPIGNNTVTYTSTDAYGNVEICSFHVVVIDSCDLNHFSCGLPVCLPNEWLCDGVPDCPDKSDENNCSSLPAVVNSPTCGLTPAITSRIVGGTDALYGQWPWIASLSVRVRDLPFYHLCGATLISDQWAMTAAHCVHPPVFELIADKLLVGDIDLYGSGATRELLDIESVYVHPAFNEFVIDYDVALIKLSAPVEIGDYISPVCLETSSEESSLYSQCISIGWGSTVSGGSLSPSLQEATFDLREIEECRNITGDDKLTENNICAWDPRGGVSICRGDSGSSLMCQEYSGTWRLVGITSANYGCADANNPGVNNLPDIYTRVSKHWDWVNSVIEGTPIYRCEDIVFPSCTAVLPYDRTYSTSQTPSYEFILDNLNEIDNKTCHRNLEALVCGSTFKECHVDGPGRIPCRQMCEEVKMACYAELQVFGLYLDRLLPCDLFPSGPSNDTLLCEYGVDYSCGNTNLIVSRTVPATITNPSFPSYGNDRHSCTWFVSVSDPTNVLLIKFLTVNIDFIVGTLLVGEGNDSANLTSVIYEVRTSSTPIETGLGSIWLSYASTFSSKGFELQLWAVQSGSTDFCSNSSSVACSLGFSCVPEEWVCDGIADCESFEDELNCTVPLNCPDGYMSCQSNEQCILSSWLCDDFYDCLDDSDEADCPTIQSCPSDGVETIPASMPFSIMSDNYPMNYPINFECLWLLQADANHSLVIDILDFTLESGYDYLYIGLGHNQSNENSVVLELTGSITPTRYYLGMKLYLQFLSDSSVSRSGFSLNVTSIPFDLTESCDVDQRVPIGSDCDGVIDCFDNSDELGCVSIDGSFMIAGIFSSDLNDPSTVLYQNTSSSIINGMDTVFESLGPLYFGAMVTGFRNGSITTHFQVQLNSLIESNDTNPLMATQQLISDSIKNGVRNGVFGVLPVINGSLVIYQDSSCPSDSVQTVPASMPYYIISENYPMDYDNNLDCLWLLQADANHSLVIDILDFTLESGYDYLYIGLGHNQSTNNSVVLELTGSISPTRYYLGMMSYLQFVSDFLFTQSGFSLNVTSIPFVLTESCDADQRVLVGSNCDGVMDCFDKSDEFECGTSCPSNNSIQTIPSSMPYSIISDNYPFNYNNNFECLWLLQAAANHSLVIDILVFTLESGYDYLYIGLGHNQSTDNSVVLELTGSIAPTRYYLGIRSYLQFVSDFSISRSGFLLIVASITLEPNISLSAGEMYNLSSPGYPSNYDNNLNLVWTILAPSDYRIIIYTTSISTELEYDFLYIGKGLTFDLNNLLIEFTGYYDRSLEVLLPGNKAFVSFTSDSSNTRQGFFLELSTSDQPAGDCGNSLMSCNSSDVCISASAFCDGLSGCINEDDEINCDASCPSDGLQTIPASTPLSIISDNYPLAYSNLIKCLWLLQAEDNHSLVIDILDFTLENGYDYLYIGLGHNRLDENSVILELTGSITPTRYYLGMQTYLYFVTDSSQTRSGFSLNITSIPFELTESCDVDQRVPIGSDCDGVIDCFDNSDELGCVSIDGSFMIAGMFSSDLNDPSTVLYQNTSSSIINGMDTVFESLGPLYFGAMVTGFRNGSITTHFQVQLNSLIESNDTNPLMATQQLISDSIKNGVRNGVFGILPVINGSLVIYQDSSCPSDSVQTVPASMPYYIISENYPMDYENNLNCLWLLQADANHSLVIDILDFTLESGYDYLYIGLGHNQSTNNSVVLELTGSIAPTRYYLGMKSYLQFVSDSSDSRFGFLLNVTSIPFEFTESCDGDQRVQVGSSCDGVIDCFDNSDELGCDSSCPSDSVQTIPASMPYYIMSKNYPMDYDNNLDCLWLLQADANHSLVIDILDFTLESGYDYLYIGLGHNQSNENSVVLELTGSISPTRYYLGMMSYLQFVSDFLFTQSGFSLNVTSIPFVLTESCDADQRVLVGSNCDGVIDCFDKSDEFECGTSCPSNNSIQTIPSSMPYSIISDNYPFNYNNNFECLWLLQAAANHSLVIDILVFTLESGYDYLYIGLGHNQSTNNSVVLELTGSIAPTRYYLGMRSYLQFVSDFSISRSGFLLNVASITLELTESCDADQRVPVGSKCDGVMDCFDNSDELGCANISLSVGEMYNLTSPGYPSNYDNNLNLVWTILAPSDYRIIIYATSISTEPEYDFLYIGKGLTFDPNNRLVEFTGYYDKSLEVLLPGNKAFIIFTSDFSTTRQGFFLEISTSSEPAGNCGNSLMSCSSSDVCISASAFCDEMSGCINGDDEINCDSSCPSDGVQSIPASLPYYILSDNYPMDYENNLNCLWLLQADANHSLVIDILDFTLESGYDYLYIGLGHNRANENTVVLELTGVLAPTRYYLGMQTYLYFVTDFTQTRSGFSLNITSIPFELTLSCDADQRVLMGSDCDGVIDCFDISDELGCVCTDEQFQCSNGLCRPLSDICNREMDCDDFGDEEDCPRCESIQESSCSSILPYNQTYYPSNVDNQTLALESLSILTNATMCHPDAHLFLCAYLFPECIHDGPTARPCQMTCQAVESACLSSFESLTGLPWSVNCEEFSDDNPLNDSSDGVLCRGPEGDITDTMICGTRPVLNERIVGGEDSVLGEWPWIGSLQRSSAGHQCAASIISRDLAITAAHCVGLFDYINVGVISKSTASPYQHISLVDVISHPDFMRANRGDDIAVLRLLDPIPEFNDYVRPICLATFEDEINNYKTCYVSGWGALEEGGPSPDILQDAIVGLISDEDCASSYTSFSSESMICAGYLAGGVDTCQGDSGGPLMCEGTDGRWHLVGITSFGNGCARPDNPGVYTRVSRYIDFISTVIDNGDLSMP
ncbi:uncharacterized protein LOC121427594 isoform X5 [Lytechinus variegatus]|uniref:uncharacterized protein LOC121427594 isoform X5 n=1 Tax=Lytechinus variegatus TaxID=7654 RepID=UPI001BB1F9F8|nr:uncharacterized protein LOC121427594 isoform X5 [Lytechinus variegatus]